MCPLCLASLAATVATTTGVGAAAVAVTTRVARSLVRRSSDVADPPCAPRKGQTSLVGAAGVSRRLAASRP